MRKKEIVLGVAVLAALALGFGAYQAYRWYEEAEFQQQRAEELASVQNLSMGEDATYTSSYLFSGELSVRVDAAALYSDIASSPIANEANVGDEQLFSSEMTGVDDFDLLIADVVIKNQDAEPTIKTQDGKSLFIMDGVAHADPSTEVIYVSDGASGVDLGYFDLPIGSEKQFTVAYAIRHDDIDVDNLSVTGAGGLGYRVHLVVDDNRQAGA